ncbi:FG-GAP repeat domain-containing protein [Sorangium sp. So ce1078]|uniref:FG-GAP repeat domain-containing protein n=1 Tax=Sorangium sp. So ce1078 TaxID=3133329 RepID=UPI003F6013D4
MHSIFAAAISLLLFLVTALSCEPGLETSGSQAGSTSSSSSASASATDGGMGGTAGSDGTGGSDGSAGAGGAAGGCTGVLTFSGPPRMSVGNNPSFVAVGDLDDDGSADLVVTSLDSSDVSVLLGRGKGSFAAAARYAVGTGPTAVALADLNGDGRTDLAVMRGVPDDPDIGAVAVLLNQGSGTFAAAVEYATGRNPVSIAAADLNGDGFPDLALTHGFNSTQTATVLFNRGDGTFAAPVHLHLDVDDRIVALSIAAADLNGDGHPDLVITGEDFGRYEGLWVLQNHGNGTFAAPVAYDAGDDPFAVTAADLNGDDHPDLAVAHYSGGVSVLLNQGDGTFTDAVHYTPNYPFRSIAAADMNGDGHPDLVVATSYQVEHERAKVLANQGDGTFAEPVDYVAGLLAVSVAAADLNGDGHIDLALANGGTHEEGTVSVLLNPGNGHFATSPYPATDAPVSIAAADLNGDGHPDLVTANAGQRGAGYASVLLNEGNSTLAAPTHYGDVLLVGGSPGPSIAAADLNDDGYPDLAVTRAFRNVVWNNQGDGTFREALGYHGGGWIAAADLNGDGYPDLASADNFEAQVWLNDGEGTFGSNASYPLDDEPGSLAVADLNGDGYPDLAVADSGVMGGVSLLLNRGDGSFGDRVLYAAGSAFNAIVAEDLNGDGRPDLAVVGPTTSVLWNEGNGTFADAVHVGPGGRAVAAADLDNDGRPDLAVVNSSGFSSRVRVLRNGGSGTFAAADYGAGIELTAVAVADVNSDGRPDLAVAVADSSRSGVIVLFNDCVP